MGLKAHMATDGLADKRGGSMGTGMHTKAREGEKNSEIELDNTHSTLDNSGLSFSLDFDMISLKPSILLFTRNVVSCANKWQREGTNLSILLY